MNKVFKALSISAVLPFAASAAMDSYANLDKYKMGVRGSVAVATGSMQDVRKDHKDAHIPTSLKGVNPSGINMLGWDFGVYAISKHPFFGRTHIGAEGYVSNSRFKQVVADKGDSGLVDLRKFSAGGFMLARLPITLNSMVEGGFGVALSSLSTGSKVYDNSGESINTLSQVKSLTAADADEPVTASKYTTEGEMHATDLDGLFASERLKDSPKHLTFDLVGNARGIIAFRKQAKLFVDVRISRPILHFTKNMEVASTYYPDVDAVWNFYKKSVKPSNPMLLTISTGLMF